MTHNCLPCGNRPNAVTELLHIMEDGDPLRTMELLMELKDLGTSRGILNDYDRTQLTNLHYLMCAILRNVTADKVQT